MSIFMQPPHLFPPNEEKVFCFCFFSLFGGWQAGGGAGGRRQGDRTGGLPAAVRHARPHARRATLPQTTQKH